ncbi:MAG: 50S ribosomal protein L29 [Candidatus Dadabacteria bacterium]|nr:50S ribosomal protein L29 [Candidatus Dadabacteria bacterium]
MAEKPAKLRELTTGDLNRKERELMSSLFNLRMRVATKQTASFARIKSLRRDIARVKTVRREIESRGGQEQVKEENG